MRTRFGFTERLRSFCMTEEQARQAATMMWKAGAWSGVWERWALCNPCRVRWQIAKVHERPQPHSKILFPGPAGIGQAADVSNEIGRWKEGETG